MCEICFSGDTEEDAIVYCDKCGSSVHINCAHLAQDVVDGEYICDYCAAGQPSCLLCRNSMPLYALRIFDNQFVHAICYRLSPFPFDYEHNL